MKKERKREEQLSRRIAALEKQVRGAPGNVPRAQNVSPVSRLGMSKLRMGKTDECSSAMRGIMKSILDPMCGYTGFVQSDNRAQGVRGTGTVDRDFGFQKSGQGFTLRQQHRLTVGDAGVGYLLIPKNGNCGFSDYTSAMYYTTAAYAPGAGQKSFVVPTALPAGSSTSKSIFPKSPYALGLYRGDRKIIPTGLAVKVVSVDAAAANQEGFIYYLETSHTEPMSFSATASGTLTSASVDDLVTSYAKDEIAPGAILNASDHEERVLVALEPLWTGVASDGDGFYDFNQTYNCCGYLCLAYKLAPKTTLTIEISMTGVAFGRLVPRHDPIIFTPDFSCVQACLASRMKNDAAYQVEERGAIERKTRESAARVSAVQSPVSLLQTLASGASKITPYADVLWQMAKTGMALI